MARMGRPPFYTNCMDFDAMCELYFDTCDEGEERAYYDKKERSWVKGWEPIPYTIADLAQFLGFNDRHALNDYSIRYPDFTATVKRARGRIEGQRNRQLVSGQGNPAGTIFDLKNNHGWKDVQETVITGNVVHTVDQLTAKLAALQADPDVQRYLSQQGQPIAIDAEYKVVE